jgi:hypothetical protein
MRTLGILVICLALLPRVAEAQRRHPSPVKPVPVEKVIKASPEAGGKTFRLDLLLKNGRQVSYQFMPEEADKAANGLSNPAIVVGQKKEVSVVYGMQIEADPQDQFVIITPRTRDRTMESMAIPLTASDNLIRTLQEKFADVKASSAKQGSHPNSNPPARQQPTQQK